MPIYHISLHHAQNANISKSEMQGWVIRVLLIIYIAVIKRGFKETEYSSLKM